MAVRAWLAVLAALLLGGCASVGERGAPVEEHRWVEVGGERFAAVATLPTAGEGNGWGALLIGGGLGNDLDWTTPGELEVGGERVRVTISGVGHADGPALARALAERGFVVWRWSTIAEGDPLAEAWPVRATPRTFGGLVEQASAALAGLRMEAGVGAGRVILVGHSLGAARAATLAWRDGAIGGLALLSPAEALASARTPASLRGEVVFLDALLSRGETPTLAVFGGEDGSRAVDASGVSALAERFGSLEARVLPGLGHQLGPMEGGLMGPMSAEALGLVSSWAEGVARGDAGAR